MSKVNIFYSIKEVNRLIDKGIGSEDKRNDDNKNHDDSGKKGSYIFTSHTHLYFNIERVEDVCKKYCAYYGDNIRFDQVNSD